jgi:hypothetical protein
VERKTKVKLGRGNYIDFGCRIICKCGNPEYFNKTHFTGNQHFSCVKCDRPLIVVNEGIPYYVGRAVFPIEDNWGSDL